MAFDMLKKFIGTPRGGHASLEFNCGLRYWRSFEDKSGLYSVNIAYHKDSSFRIMCRNNVEKWREKIDALTSSAEYDLTVRRAKP